MKKILLVDDDELMADMYQTLLTLENYDVTCVGDSEDVHGKAQELMPSLILLDVMMPKLNGFEVLKVLKNDPGTKSIPVIMLTNLSVPEEVDNALSLGAIKYLIKSEYLPREIAQIVKETVGN
jgi:CheY-like chemotaxis protein